MQNKLLLCGCGWLGGYAAEHFKSDFAITGTTRSESKAQQLASQGIQPLLFGLGQPLDALIEAANNSVAVSYTHLRAHETSA